jgi:flagellar protein FlbD
MQATPDTTITMTTGDKYIVRESIDEITDKFVIYKRGFFGISEGGTLV